MPADVSRVANHAGLVSIALNREYRKAKSWVAVKYRTMYGEWPPWEAPEPQNPSAELSWWIRREGREYAKARKAQEGLPTPQAKPESALMSDDDWRVVL